MTKIEEAEREQRLHYEIIVDAYDSDERISGWFHYLQDEMSFPFIAKAVKDLKKSPLKSGELVKVTELADYEVCERGMSVQIELDGRDFAIPLEQLELVRAENGNKDSEHSTREAILDWHYWIDSGYEF